MRCLFGQNDGGGSVPFVPQTSEGPPPGGRHFRRGPGMEPGPKGQQEGGWPSDQWFSDVLGLTTLSGNESFSLKTTACPLPSLFPSENQLHTWDLFACATSDVGGHLGGGRHRGEGLIWEAPCAGSKEESADSELRISKEGEVSGDGSLVLTKVMKGEVCELHGVTSARENGMGEVAEEALFPVNLV